MAFTAYTVPGATAWNGPFGFAIHELLGKPEDSWLELRTGAVSADVLAPGALVQFDTGLAELYTSGNNVLGVVGYIKDPDTMKQLSHSPTLTDSIIGIIKASAALFICQQDDGNSDVTNIAFADDYPHTYLGAQTFGITVGAAPSAANFWVPQTVIDFDQSNDTLLVPVRRSLHRNSIEGQYQDVVCRIASARIHALAA